MFCLAVVFNNVSHVWIGAYLFEVLQSLGFEWSVITGRRKFTLPMLVRDQLALAYRSVTHPDGPIAVLLHEVDVVCGLCGHVSAV